MTETIRVDTLDGSAGFSAYCARPSDPPRGAIVVIQEIFGVNPGIRKKCDNWAAKGYLAIAPDLFWRMEPGVELDPDVPEEMERAFGLMQRFDAERSIYDIEATIRLARAEIGGGKVGLVGYCLGGRLAYLAATRTDVDASVGYYGVGIDELLTESHAIANPLLLHFAERDHFVPTEKIDIIERELGNNPHVTIHRYPGVDHGFAAEVGQRRVEDAARLADSRTEAFFEASLA